MSNIALNVPPINRRDQIPMAAIEDVVNQIATALSSTAHYVVWVLRIWATTGRERRRFAGDYGYTVEQRAAGSPNSSID